LVVPNHYDRERLLLLSTVFTTSGNDTMLQKKTMGQFYSKNAWITHVSLIMRYFITISSISNF